MVTSDIADNRATTDTATVWAKTKPVISGYETYLQEEFESRRKIDTNGPGKDMNLEDSASYPEIVTKIRKYYGSSGELYSSSLGNIKSLILGSSNQADKESAILEYITRLSLLCLGDKVNLATSNIDNPKLGILLESMQAIAQGLCNDTWQRG